MKDICHTLTNRSQFVNFQHFSDYHKLKITLNERNFLMRAHIRAHVHRPVNSRGAYFWFLQTNVRKTIRAVPFRMFLICALIIYARYHVECFENVSQYARHQVMVLKCYCCKENSLINSYKLRSFSGDYRFVDFDGRFIFWKPLPNLT